MWCTAFIPRPAWTELKGVGRPWAPTIYCYAGGHFFISIHTELSHRTGGDDNNILTLLIEFCFAVQLFIAYNISQNHAPQQHNMLMHSFVVRFNSNYNHLKSAQSVWVSECERWQLIYGCPLLQQQVKQYQHQVPSEVTISEEVRDGSPSVLRDGNYFVTICLRDGVQHAYYVHHILMRFAIYVEKANRKREPLFIESHRMCVHL